LAASEAARAKIEGHAATHRSLGSMITVKRTPTRHVAEADKAYLEAKKMDGRFRMGGDPESAFMFGEDVKGARERYLLALEAAYRE
jgi:hypothetical protein